MIGGLNNRRVLKLLFWVPEWDFRILCKLLFWAMILFCGEIHAHVTVSGMGQHGNVESVASVCPKFSIISHGIKFHSVGRGVKINRKTSRLFFDVNC